jgi:hypothetical protein
VVFSHASQECGAAHRVLGLARAVAGKTAAKPPLRTPRRVLVRKKRPRGAQVKPPALAISHPAASSLVMKAPHPLTRRGCMRVCREKRVSYNLNKGAPAGARRRKRCLGPRTLSRPAAPPATGAAPSAPEVQPEACRQRGVLAMRPLGPYLSAPLRHTLGSARPAKQCVNVRHASVMADEI